MIDTEATYLHALFQRAEETPSKTWMQEVGGDDLTFAQSRDLACRWADALRRSGVREGDMVATMLENCLDTQHVWLGAALIQAVEVPLSPLLRGESLVHALNDSRSKVIAVAEQFHRHIEAVSERLEHLERVVIMQSAKTVPESAFEIVSELPKTHTMRVQKAKLRDLPRTNDWDRVAAGVYIKELADA